MLKFKYKYKNLYHPMKIVHEFCYHIESNDMNRDTVLKWKQRLKTIFPVIMEKNL